MKARGLQDRPRTYKSSGHDSFIGENKLPSVFAAVPTDLRHGSYAPAYIEREKLYE